MRWSGTLRLGAILLLAAPALADQEREVIRDGHGRRTGTVEPGVGGRQIIRDEQGRRVGEIDRRQFRRDKAVPVAR